MPEALKKKNKDGSLYKRPPEIEAKLEQLEGVEPKDRIRLFESSSRKHPDYMSSEVLVYFLRRDWADGKTGEFEQIFKILMKRVDISLQSAIKKSVGVKSSKFKFEILRLNPE